MEPERNRNVRKRVWEGRKDKDGDGDAMVQEQATLRDVENIMREQRSYLVLC